MPSLVFAHLLLQGNPQFTFLPGPAVNEMMALRWLHFIFGIIWIGLLYFFNLVGTPALKQLDPPVRAKIYPELMSRAMFWFRWSSLITVLVGMRYFLILLTTEARNSGDRGIVWRSFGSWLAVWLIAYVFLYLLQLPAKGFRDHPLFRVIAISLVVFLASWLVLYLNGGPASSNSHLAISVGGGLGLLMLLNTWGVVWRVQKRMITWTRAAAEQGTPLPPEAERLMRWNFLTARISFWLTLPMLFFMGAASHYPFLGSLPKQP